MRSVGLFLGFLFVAVATSTRVEAQYYPWCAIYSGLGTGASCGYTTFERCMASVRSLGGFCEQNPQSPSPASGAYSTGRSYRSYPYAY
jgi:Protein of unknown function (DUF3551)